VAAPPGPWRVCWTPLEPLTIDELHLVYQHLELEEHRRAAKAGAIPGSGCREAENP
jgi:hypothetical protein